MAQELLTDDQKAGIEEITRRDLTGRKVSRLHDLADIPAMFSKVDLPETHRRTVRQSVTFPRINRRIR